MSTMSKHPDPPPKPSDDIMGRCSLCGTEIIRYGPHGKPLCTDCDPQRKDPGSHPSGEPGPSAG